MMFCRKLKKKIFYEIYFHRYIYFKMKKYFLLIFSFIAIFLFVFVVLKNKHFEPINIKDLLIQIQNYKLYVNENKLLFVIIYLFFSILWTCLLGIMTPMLLLSTLMFEYLAFILSTISFSIGSTISYFFANFFLLLIYYLFLIRNFYITEKLSLF